MVWFFLNRHRFGAHVYLTGDNQESARLMGVNVDRTKTIAFAVVGLAAAFAGFVVSEEVLFFWPTLGDGYLLNTLASVFLGGTSVFGGTGTIFGTFVASFIIGAINAGIVAAGLTGFWTQPHLRPDHRDLGRPADGAGQEIQVGPSSLHRRASCSRAEAPVMTASLPPACRCRMGANGKECRTRRRNAPIPRRQDCRKSRSQNGKAGR